MANVHAQRRPAIAPIFSAPRSDLDASFRCDSGKMLWPDGRHGHRRVTNGGYGSGCSSATVIVLSNGASQCQGGFDVGWRHALWFVLAAAALLFVALDIRTTPESAVLKWGFVLLTAYTGVVGAFLYVL